MTYTKLYNCKDCETKDREDFSGHSKSLCRKCRNLRTKIYRSSPEQKLKRQKYKKKYTERKKLEKELEIKKKEGEYPRFNIVFTEYPVVLRWD